MSITKTIGGDRLGSGKKLQTSLESYGRSTHNLSEDFISSAAPGMLIPFYTNIGLNGDVFDINLNAAVRTLPTTAPLFGSFKLQLDVFEIPIRLYQGLLHNNPTNLGMKMSQVKLPKIEIPALNGTRRRDFGLFKQISKNCLMRYLGLGGVGINQDESSDDPIYRKVNALPLLAYYDIFKNYYANKQETNAFVVKPALIKEKIGLTDFDCYIQGQYLAGSISVSSYKRKITFTNEDVTGHPIYITFYNETKPYNLNMVRDYRLNFDTMDNAGFVTVGELVDGGVFTPSFGRVAFEGEEPKDIWYCRLETPDYFQIQALGWDFTEGHYITIESRDNFLPSEELTLASFPLDNIDKMRRDILTFQTLGSEFVLGSAASQQGQYLPYSTNFETADAKCFNEFSCNGLVVKTYQSDIFNNWLNTDWIDGDNGISAITAVDVSDGALSLDALNLAQKVYNMLNRVAISGGTYDDWQEAVFGIDAIRKAETPVYCGGYQSEVVFEEVVSTAETDIADNLNVVGSLAGKGRLSNAVKGGVIHIKCSEPCLIMGIMSLTPRICYSQGNAWYLTELNSIDDIHKPALDGIGYQELITEQMAWFDTEFDDNGKRVTKSAGKIPAWLNYMTSVSHAYGDFADPNQAAYMVLGRNYEFDETSGGIKDLTTYIDPTKFNYPFAYTKLDAQNFWVQIGSKVTARRVMSAKVIPNL